MRQDCRSREPTRVRIANWSDSSYPAFITHNWAQILYWASYLFFWRTIWSVMKTWPIIVSGHLNVLHYAEIACRLFFCDTEEDIWDIVKDGYANAESFLLTYGGYHRTRLEQEPIFTASAIRQERFCRYIQDAFPWLKPMHEFLQNVSYTFSPEEFSIGNWIGK